MYVLSYGLLAGQDLGQGAPMIPGTESELTVRLIYSGIGLGAYVMPIVLGIVVVTSEYRYRTMSLTYLATPNRWQVAVAKFVVAIVWGAIFGAITIAISLPTANLIIGNNPDAFQLGTETITAIALGTVGGFAMYSALGVGIGMLLRNQIGAIVGALTWVFVIEAIFMAIVPNVGKWLPGGAMAALTESRALTGEAFLSASQGLLLLSAYAVVVVGLAIASSNNRDLA
jgi:ABC-type transport system involved in multi-copper enzyme maturation permease subunit